MSFELDGLPDSLVHTQFVLHGVSALPTGAKRQGIVDLFALSFCERADVSVRFALVLDATISPVAGLLFWRLGHRLRPQNITPTPDTALSPRLDEHRLFEFCLHNASGGPLALGDVVVTLAGFPLAPRPHDATSTALGLTAPPSGAPAEIQARTMGGAALGQNWLALP